jgi:hypothetical protein
MKMTLNLTLQSHKFIVSCGHVACDARILIMIVDGSIYYYLRVQHQFKVDWAQIVLYCY